MTDAGGGPPLGSGDGGQVARLHTPPASRVHRITGQARGRRRRRLPWRSSRRAGRCRSPSRRSGGTSADGVVTDAERPLGVVVALGPSSCRLHGGLAPEPWTAGASDGRSEARPRPRTALALCLLARVGLRTVSGGCRRRRLLRSPPRRAADPAPGRAQAVPPGDLLEWWGACRPGPGRLRCTVPWTPRACCTGAGKCRCVSRATAARIRSAREGNQRSGN